MRHTIPHVFCTFSGTWTSIERWSLALIGTFITYSFDIIYITFRRFRICFGMASRNSWQFCVASTTKCTSKTFILRYKWGENRSTRMMFYSSSYIFWHHVHNSAWFTKFIEVSKFSNVRWVYNMYSLTYVCCNFGPHSCSCLFYNKYGVCSQMYLSVYNMHLGSVLWHIK